MKPRSMSGDVQDTDAIDPEWWGFIKDKHRAILHHVPCTQDGIPINWHTPAGYECWCKPYLKQQRKPYIQHQDAPYGGYHC